LLGALTPGFNLFEIRSVPEGTLPSNSDTVLYEVLVYRQLGTSAPTIHTDAPTSSPTAFPDVDFLRPQVRRS
jgi:hypothetical protein